jgi:hypothetical protein
MCRRKAKLYDACKAPLCWTHARERHKHGSDTVQHLRRLACSREATHFLVQVPQLGHVGADDLATSAQMIWPGHRKIDRAQAQREEHVQEQDPVCPEDALLLRL